MVGVNIKYNEWVTESSKWDSESVLRLRLRWRERPEELLEKNQTQKLHGPPRKLC